MLTQNIIEQFFLKIIEELRNENIPILNNYWSNWEDFPYVQDLIDREEELEDDYYDFDEIEIEN
jgi:hypothetical protein